MRALVSLLISLVAIPGMAGETGAWRGTDVRQILGICIAAQPGSTDIQPWGDLVDVARHCPDLHAWLVDAHDAGFIEMANPNAPLREGLIELDTMVAALYREASPPARAVMDPRDLDVIMEELERPPGEALSWWERLRAWLRSRMKANDPDLAWLEEILADLVLPDALANALFSVLVAGLILIAILIVGNEARLFGWRREAGPAHGRRSANDAAPLLEQRETTWVNIDALPPRARISAALRLLMALPAAGSSSTGLPRSRTNQELAQALSRSQEPKGIAPSNRVGEIFNVMDEIIYGDKPVDEDHASQLVELCRQLATGPDGTPAAAVSVERDAPQARRPERT